MTEPSAPTGPPIKYWLPDPRVTLVEGSTFCISERWGDIRPGYEQGLFVRDTRVLSRWELTVDGAAPLPLTVQQAQPYSAMFLCRVPPPGHGDSTLLVERDRYVGEGHGTGNRS